MNPTILVNKHHFPEAHREQITKKKLSNVQASKHNNWLIQNKTEE
jgi:hypothetical protein